MDPYTTNSLPGLALITGREKESLGLEICKMNGCLKTETNICAGDDYCLATDISIRNRNRLTLFAEKGADGELGHDDRRIREGRKDQ